MPDISDYSELSLEGMNLDEVTWGGSVLRAEFGDGYAAESRNGNINGLHRWTLSAGVLPDDEMYGNLIEGQARFAYYLDFFKEHTTGTQRVFLIEFRGRKYFAEFVETEISAEIFTSDLYGGGVAVRQRRVPGFYEGTDGCVFDPSFVATGIWGWYDGDSFDYFTDQVIDKSGNDHTLDIHGDVTGGTDGERATARFGFVVGAPEEPMPGDGGYINTAADPVIYEAFFRMKVRASTFTGYQGILTASATTAALVGNTGDTKLVPFSFGVTYKYWHDGVLKTEATQTAPMAAWGVIHARWENGITLSNLQIGKDRADTDRFGLYDVSDIVLCDALLDDDVSTDMDGYLLYF